MKARYVAQKIVDDLIYELKLEDPAISSLLEGASTKSIVHLIDITEEWVKRYDSNEPA